MKLSIPGRPLAVVSTVLLLPVIALSFFAPSYQTNDDVVMRLLAEGNFVPGDAPLPYLMFINVIVGVILSLAYRVTTTVPWYDLVLGGSMIAASLALVHTWAGSGRRWQLAWALVLAAYFLLPTFISVQFSLAGLACSAGGFGLIMRALITDLDPRSRRRHLLLGVALFFWGSLIRFPGAVLMFIEGGILTFPFLVGTLRNRAERPRVRGVVLATCAALVLTGLGFWMGQVAYRQAKGWKNFYEYNILRLRLAEYISPERTNPETAARLAKEVGWSANDFALFRNWFFTDPDLFSLHRVQQAVNLFYGTTSEPPDGWRKARLERSLDVGTTFFRETRWAILLLGVFVLAQGLRPKLVIYFVGTVLTLGLLVMGINLTMKAPPLRIFWPMLIMAATTLTLATQRWGRPVHWSINCAAILTAICVVGIAQPSMKDESERRRQAAEVATADVESLRRTGATMYILHGNAFPYEDFWSPLQTKTAAFDFVGLGVSARTPPVQEFLARTGMTDLPFSLCTQSGMVFVAHPYMIPMLTTFLSEHRGMTVEFIEAYKGRRILAWRCRQKSGEPERPV